MSFSPNKKSEKVRIDQLLLQRGLAPSRERAQALVMAGKVLVDEQRVEKSSQKFDPQNINIRLKGPDHPFVSRGGVKLKGALDHFGIDPKGKTCLDVGASTGGFTDCLLQEGAQKVYTLDSGTNQLDYAIRRDPRVQCREQFNIRHLKASDLPEPLDLIVVDVSFISLKLVLPPLVNSIPGPWDLVMLIKPQFEAGREQVEKGGLVRDRELQEKIVEELLAFCKKMGLKTLGTSPSVLKGDKGNQEYFLWARQRKATKNR